MSLFDCSDPAQRSAGMEAAAAAVRVGQLVVLPTDTVYGIGVDAFRPAAVTALLAAKGRGRQMPPPVLVGSVRAATALIEDLGLHGHDLIEEFWPGALTLVCAANRTLSWDLGETKGTVAVRMPLHPVALELLRQTGPMAVSSANRSGAPAAVTAAEAMEQLGDSVRVYLDAGPCTSRTPSSIVDLTGAVPRLLRAGAISPERLRAVAPLIDGTVDEGGREDEAGGSHDASGNSKTGGAADAGDTNGSGGVHGSRGVQGSGGTDGAGAVPGAG